MEEKNLFNIIRTSKSKNDVLLKYFGYSNKRTYDKLNFFIKENNIETAHWEPPIKKCLFCNDLIDSHKKFCNSSCSAKYNNKGRTQSKETRNKISESLNKVQRITHRKPNKEIIKICIVCEEKFSPKRFSNERISQSKCCSIECHHVLVSRNSKALMNKRMMEGTHSGWQTRNIISFPEQFFIKVLNNNNIKFEHNFPINKKDLGLNEPYSYFLDFYLADKKIDLEIDGKQHKERKEHDDRRDEVLINNGYSVYRIKWKNINSEKGKMYIKNEIDRFLKYYEKHTSMA